MLSWSRKGQITFEYAIIIGIVALSLTMMQVYLRRGIQAGIKMAADEIGLQEDFKELDMKKRFLDSSTVVQATSEDIAGTEDPQAAPTVQTIAYQGNGAQTTEVDEKLSSVGESRYLVKDDDDTAAEDTE